VFWKVLFHFCTQKSKLFTLQRFRFSCKGYAEMKSLQTSVFREYYICLSILLSQVFLSGARCYMRILTNILMSAVTSVC
jgi:hypothetical protein